MLYSQETTRYFNAEDYKDKGYMDHSTINTDVYYFTDQGFMSIVKYVARSEIQFYSFKWLDTSNIALLNINEEFTNYHISSVAERPAKMKIKTGIAEVVYDQSKKKSTTQWQIQSLDVVLGLVGGFVSIIWGALNILFSEYEYFKLQNSLISAVYPTSPQGRDDSDFDDSSGESGP